MKDTGKRLCLPYLLSSQSHSPGWRLGHAPKAKPGKVVLAGLLPLALTLGGEGGWQEQVAAGGFPSEPAFSEPVYLPVLGYLPEGGGGAGVSETSQNCTCPSGNKPRGSRALVTESKCPDCDRTCVLS